MKKYLTNPDVRARAIAVVKDAQSRLSAVMGEPVTLALSFLTAEDAAKPDVAPATLDAGLGSPGAASAFLRRAANECEDIQFKVDQRAAQDAAFMDAMSAMLFAMMADIEGGGLFNPRKRPGESFPFQPFQQYGRARRPASYRPSRFVGELPDITLEVVELPALPAPPKFPDPGSDPVEGAPEKCPDCGGFHG